MNNYIGDKGEIGDNGKLEKCYHLLHYNNIIDSEKIVCTFDLSKNEQNIKIGLILTESDNTFSLSEYNDISNNVFVEIYAHTDVSNINGNGNVNGNNSVFTFMSLSGEQLINIDTRSVIKEKFNVLHLSYGPIILNNNQINFNDKYNLTIETTNQHNILIREIKLIIKLLKK